MREFYRVAAGSRRFGLELADSDYDYWIIADCDNQHSEFFEKNHYIYYPIAKGIRQLSGWPQLPHWVITLFPLEANSPIAAYMMENADRIVAANRKHLYSLLLDYTQNYGIYDFQSAYAFIPKMAAYRIMWSDIYLQYEACGSMSQAIKEADSSLYRAIRKQEIEFNELIEINQERQTKLYCASGFFDVRPDTEYLEQVQHDLELIIGGKEIGRKENIQPQSFGLCELQNEPKTAN